MINHNLEIANARDCRVIAGRVAVGSGTPSVSKGEGYTVVDTAAGQVKIVFDKPGRAVLAAVATAVEGTDATGHYVKVDAVTEATDVTFGIYVADGTDGALADDVGFYFIIIVKDAA